MTLTNSRLRMSTIVMAAVAVVVCVSVAWSQNGTTEPVYRVAADAATPQATAAAPKTPGANASGSPITRANGSGSPFDLSRQPEEHPLVPLARALKTSQEVLESEIRDYSCTFVKRERVDGQLGDFQHIFMKVMHEPFSVYMSFLKPFAGREVAYVAGQNENKLIVLEAGFKRWAGKVPLDPNGALAMKGQKYPITRVGIKNLTADLLKLCETEMKYAECDVTHNTDTKIHGRPTTMIQVVHPIPRQNFRAHVMRLFFDNELRVPIHYDAFGWPAQQGGQPPLEESYTYQNLKINNGFAARDFDAYNNPEIFKP